MRSQAEGQIIIPNNDMAAVVRQAAFGEAEVLDDPANLASGHLCLLKKGVLSGSWGRQISIIRGNFVICVFTVGRIGYAIKY